jgi:dsRNA-specific ribonuclease
MSDLNKAFEDEIGYNFSSQTLLNEALQSPGDTSDGEYSAGNKRLALVGDSVLALMLLDRWYEGDSSTRM